MIILDTFAEIGFYRTGLAIKNIVKIASIIVPIMIMILGMIDIGKITSNPDEAKNQIKKLVDRIIAGLIVFILPTIMNYGLSLIKSYDKNTIFKYYEGASKQKIQQLEAQYKSEQIAQQNKEKAEALQLAKENEAAEAKRRAQQEKRFEEGKKQYDNNNNQGGNGGGGNGNGGGTGNSGGNGNSGGSSYTGDSSSGGTYGSVTVSNGVFTIPNRRATSNSDIPKQSGQYGLNPIFWERLSKMISDASALGYKITVTSGWRSYSSQRSLWDNSKRACNVRSKWVACPGGSRHGFGIAADLKFNGTSCSGGWDCNAAAKWAHANAGNYNLKFRMSWEPWHIEPAQVNGGNFGKCTASC